MSSSKRLGEREAQHGAKERIRYRSDVFEIQWVMKSDTSWCVNWGTRAEMGQSAYKYLSYLQNGRVQF